MELHSLAGLRLELSVGLFSHVGGRTGNDDYAGSLLGADADAGRSFVAALADGVGGSRGGRVAAEIAVRQFIDGYLSQKQPLPVAEAGRRVLRALNHWIHAQGRSDPELQSMACTFTALVLKGRQAHVFHIGDSRLYRLREGRLQQLTSDHVVDRPEQRHLLLRALGLEEDLRADYREEQVSAHDRYLLCSDGVHGVLREARLREILSLRASAQESARQLVEAALAAGTRDNATALIVDILNLPRAEAGELLDSMAALPIQPPPRAGDQIDGFRILEPLASGRYSRVYRATDSRDGRELVLKFAKPLVGEQPQLRKAFAREAWIGANVQSRWLGEVLELPPGRASRLYLAMPFYPGETLERRLRRHPPVSLDRGIDVAVKLCRAVFALHRAGVIHRDIKPDNVIVDGPGVKLIDFGSARRRGEQPEPEVPGTPSYMAPELLHGAEGALGDERSDLFSLGVTVYRMFSGGPYPYGEIEPFSKPRFGKAPPLSKHRPDLPAWLDAVIAQAIAPDRSQRPHDCMELASALENNLVRAPAIAPKRFQPLYERNPLAFWKVVAWLSLLLNLILLASRR